MSLDSSPSDKRKSFVIASLIYGLLLLILFFIRFWPPSDEEILAMAGGGGGGGVTINFGDTDFGSGKNYDSKELEVKNNTQQALAKEIPEEDIITQDEEGDKSDAIVGKNDPVKNPKTLIKPEVVKPLEVKKPVVKKVDEALANILHGNKKGGDGNSSSSGNQGRANGDINSNGYNGSGVSGGGSGGGNGKGNGTGSGMGTGSGSGGGNGSGTGKGTGSGYALGGRKPLNKPAPENCGNDTGTIVVKIIVDKNGTAISASPGYRGTKNSTSCMLNAAKIAALATKWEPSSIGAEKQEGTITYNFTIMN